MNFITKETENGENPCESRIFTSIYYSAAAAMRDIEIEVESVIGVCARAKKNQQQPHNNAIYSKLIVSDFIFSPLFVHVKIE